MVCCCASNPSSLWQCGHVTASCFVVQAFFERGSPQSDLTRPASTNGKWIAMLKPCALVDAHDGGDVRAEDNILLESSCIDRS